MSKEIKLNKTLFADLSVMISVFLFLFIILFVEFNSSAPYNYQNHTSSHYLLPEYAILGLLTCILILFLETIYIVLFKKTLLLISEDGITFKNGIAIANEILVPWQNIISAKLHDEGLYLIFTYREVDGEKGYVNHIAKTKKSFIDINEEIKQYILNSRK